MKVRKKMKVKKWSEVYGDENKVLDEFNLQNYDDVEKRLAEEI